MKREKLIYRLSLRIIIICLIFGFLGAAIIIYTERQNHLNDQMQLIDDIGSYYYNETNSYIQDGLKTAATANESVVRALFQENKKTANWTSNIKKGIEGEYRSNDGLSGGFFSNINTLTPAIIEQFNKTGEIWEILAPQMINHFQNFWIITKEGFTRVSPVKWAMEWEPNHDFTEDIFYYSADQQNNSKREAIWSPVYYDSILESWMTSLIIPMYKNETFEGVTGSDLPLDTLLEYLSQIANKGSGLEILIFDERGNIIFHPEYIDEILIEKPEMNTLLDSKKIEDESLKQFISKFNKGEYPFNEPITYREKGEIVYARSYVLDLLNWRFIVYKRNELIYKPIKLLQLEIFFFAITFALLLAAIIHQMIKSQVIDRINNLTKASKEYTPGALSTMENLRDDEIGVLTESFLQTAIKTDQHISSLKQAQTETARIIEASTLISLIAIDTKGIITQFNKGAERLIGYDREEMVGIHTPTRFHLESEIEERGNELSKIYNKKLEGVNAFVYVAEKEGYEEREWTYVKKDGTRIKVYLSVTPIFDEMKNITGFLGVAMNITKRKLQELELGRLRDFLSNIINSISSVIVVVNEDMKILKWNIALIKSTGLTPEELLDKELKEILPSMEMEYSLINKAIETKEYQNHLKRKITQEGILLFENILIYPLVGQAGKGAVVHIENVTESVQMEEMIIQNEKMLSVGGLAAGMAHEINNPLAGIMQTISVMNNRILGGEKIKSNMIASEEAEISMESINKYMELRDIPRMIYAITESGKRIAKIVENMLSFARKSEGQHSLHPLESIMNNSIDMAFSDYNLPQQYDFRKINIETDYSLNVPAIPCDKSKIQQVILNILQNGAQAMFSSNTVNPRFKISLDFDSETKMVYLSIQDNGPGMTDDIRKRIFEPFFTTKSEGKGTGLGLSVSYFIITENHNGTLTLTTEPDKGTTFIIGLPIEQKEKVESEVY